MTGWDLAYGAIAPFFLASAAWKRWRHGKYRQSLPGMFGANRPRRPLPPHRERVWLHSVSVGETVGAGAVFRRLRERHPDWQFVSTTTTETGQEQARRSLAEANVHDFAPADFSANVRGFLRAYRPSVYLFFETEIWPNTLLECRRAGLPVFLVNGKMSERSGARYARFRSLLAGPLSALTAAFVQSEDDAERYRRVLPAGVPITVTGNVKFDSLPAPLSAEDRAALRAEWGIGPGELVVLAGSTHPGEEAEILRAWRALGAAGITSRLVIAPRHPERFAAVTEELRAMGADVHRLSAGPPPRSDQRPLLLLDRMGVLARSFGAADIALLGGSWNPIGGHNLLEPMAHGIPVLHGPHMHAQREIMRIAGPSGGCLGVPVGELGTALVDLAGDPLRRAKMGTAGRRAAQANRGAALRVVEAIEGYLANRERLSVRE